MRRYVLALFAKLERPVLTDITAAFWQTAGWMPPPSPMNKTIMKRDTNHGMLLRMEKTGPVPTVSLGAPTATPVLLLALFGILALLAGGLCWQLRRRIAP